MNLISITKTKKPLTGVSGFFVNIREKGRYSLVLYTLKMFRYLATERLKAPLAPEGITCPSKAP